MIVYEERSCFRDRTDAGRHLAEKLTHYQGRGAVVLAVPRGGVPVAVEVADKLGSPLDVVVPRKIAIPRNPEAGYGAVTEDGTLVLNESLVEQLGLTQHQIEFQAEEVRIEIARRSGAYRGGLAPSRVEGKTVIVVDDGLASGYTMIAAIKSAQRRKAAEVVVAVPVASGTAYDLVRPLVDELVCLVIARTYGFAVASFYRHWSDLTDEEVIKYLKNWRAKHK